MLMGKVVGSAVATLKDERLGSSKLLVVQRVDATGEITGEPFLAIDLAGAGAGEWVVVVRGSSARVASGSQDAPVDAAIVGILDSIQVAGTAD
jgi:ethanolamine utilization protein EutN